MKWGEIAERTDADGNAIRRFRIVRDELNTPAGDIVDSKIKMSFNFPSGYDF